MHIEPRAISAAAGVFCLWTHCVAADTLKIASPQPGSWESAIPVLGQQQGFFRQQDLELEVVNTSGSGETLQAVISGAVDVGLSAGTVGVLGAYARGAPIRIIGASETGSTDTFWYVTAKSSIRSMHEARDATLAYSTIGASSHLAVLRFISEYGLNARPVATGNPAATVTQVMTGQVDVGWAVAPFALDAIDRGEIRVIGRASDIATIREQTIRVQVTNTRTLAERTELVQRFHNGYRATLDWMYASPDAVPRYVAYSGFSANAVRRMMQEFIPKESLQMDEIKGLSESMADAIRFKFISAPLTQQEVKELIQIPRP
jgi:ABC-type nitrate/sulfonate/bicarbonate transport system substrate-binding protein